MPKIFLLLFALISSGTAQAKEKWLVVTEDAPPLQYLVDGEVYGKSTELVKEVLGTSQLIADIEVYPWARAYETAINRPNTLIYSTIRTQQRESLFHWIGKIGRFQLDFVSLSSNKEFNVDSLEDVKLSVVGTMRDDFTHDYLTSQGFSDSDLVIRSSLLELVDLLYKRRIDTFIVDRTLVCDLVIRKGLDCAEMQVALALPELGVDVYLAANRASDVKDVERLKDAFNAVKARPKYRDGFSGY